jgi:hypothetical protein
MSTAFPTALEIDFWRRLNAARKDPNGYCASLGITGTSYQPAPPLALQLQMMSEAQSHALDEATHPPNGYYNHYAPQPGVPVPQNGIIDPATGIAPWTRLDATGYVRAGASFSETAGAALTSNTLALADLIIDAPASFTQLGHRLALLGQGYVYRDIGIGVLQGTADPWHNHYVQDLAVRWQDVPSISGLAPAGTLIQAFNVGSYFSMSAWECGAYTLDIAVGQWLVIGGQWQQFITVTSDNATLDWPNGKLALPALDLIGWCYAYYLHRSADANGRTYWQSLINQGQDANHIQAGFLSSAEYMAANDFVPSLYANLLFRNGDQPGLAYWRGQLAAGMSAFDVAMGFLTSAERLAIIANWS